MLETVGVIIGIIVGVFILIFGGRGLMDLARERRERKRQTSLSTTTIVDQTETISSVKEPISTGPLTEATTIGSQPLVGRKKEVSFLKERVDEALQGRGSVVFITGQAGIGKTRLAREVRDHAVGTGCQWLEGKYEKAVSQPYKAWSDIVRSYLHQKGTSLQSVAGPYAVHLAKIVPEIGVDLESSPAAGRGDPEGERFRLFEGLTQFFVHVSQEAPLVLFFDDLQWASSIDLMHHLSQRIGNQRVLMMAAYRDDELKENPNLWRIVLEMNRERLFHSLPLKALDEGEVGLLVSSTVEGSVAPQLLEAIYQRTEGNPFFVEEVVRFLREREAIVHTETGWDVRESSSLETPDSVKVVITERLEQLGQDAREALRMASVIGREYSLRLLRELVEQSEEALIEVMDRCEKAGLVARKRFPGEEVYSFSHDLLQEALYESIGSARRSRQHLRIGQALEKLYTTGLEQRFDALAHHFLEGNDLEKTVAYSWQAGRKAAAQSAYGNAVEYFEQALGALGHLPESRETLEQAIDLRIDLRQSLYPLGEFGRILDYLGEAETLAKALGDQHRLGRISAYMLNYFFITGNQDRAIEIGQRTLARAEALADIALQVEASYRLGQAYWSLGDYRQAITCFGRNVVCLKGDLIRERFGMPGLPSVNSRAWLVWCLAEQGAFAEGRERGEDVVRLAEALAEAMDHPFSLSTAHWGVGHLYLRQGELSKAIPALERSLEICQVSHMRLLFPWFASPLGYAYALAGRVAEALPLLEQAVEQSASMRLTVGQSLWITHWSEAYLLVGRMDEAITQALRALELSRAHKERGHEGYALRLLGEITAHKDPADVGEAEDHYRQALAIAEELGMRPLMAHCHLGLGRLYRWKDSLQQAKRHLTTATTMMRDMQMGLWLEKAEAELKELR